MLTDYLEKGMTKSQILIFIFVIILSILYISKMFLNRKFVKIDLLIDNKIIEETKK